MGKNVLVDLEKMLKIVVKQKVDLVNMKKIKITQYKWAGRKLFFEIRSSCNECDTTTAILKNIVQEYDGKVELEVKPWLNSAFSLLLKGGWHAPIVFIEDKIVSQGKIPDKNNLIREIESHLQ